MMIANNIDNRCKFYALILFLILSLSGCSFARGDVFSSLSGGDSLRLSIQESILLALENNPTVSIQRLQPEIEKTFAREYRAAFDPQLNISASQDKNKTQRFLGAARNPFELTTERSQYNASLTETLPTGTDIAASASLSGTLSSIYTDQYSGNLGLTITQSLLQGAGTGANLATLRQARLDVEISREELKAVAENLVADVENAYWSLYLAAEEISIQKQSLELANKQLQESLERVAVGKLPELELAAVHAEVSARQEALIDASSNYQQARLRFLYLLNPSMDTEWRTVTMLADRPFVPVDTLADVSAHEELGLKYRSDLKQAYYALQKGELEIQRTKNGLLPRLDLFISLSRTTYAESFRDGLPDIKSPFYDVNVGLTFDFPVINRQARAQSARARWSKDQLELSVENMKRLVQWDVRAAYIEVLRSREQIQATRVTRELQDKKLAAELEKFRVGKSTNFLVLQAQSDLTASRLDEARSMVSYLNSLIRLYLVEGTLLERRGINSPAA